MTNKVQAAKNLAKQIAQALGQHGQELPHSVLLEVVAKAQGARNWHAFQAEPATPVSVAPVSVAPQWSPMQGPMTSERYTQGRGLRCPVCGNRHYVNSGKVEADGDSAWCEVKCGSCGSTWTDAFGVFGMYDLQLSDWASENKLVFALDLWLTEDDFEPNQSRRYSIDEMVTDGVYRHNQRLAMLNGLESAAQQEAFIEDAEEFASSLNNEGLPAQLRFLKGLYDSDEEFIEDLSQKCEISRDTLKL